MIEHAYILLDPIECLRASIAPGYILGRYLLNDLGIETTIVSIFIKDDVKEKLETEGFGVESPNKKMLTSGSILTFEGWLRKTYFKVKKNSIVVNFSQSLIPVTANGNGFKSIYYAQGMIVEALKDLEPDLPMHYRLVLKTLLMTNILKKLDSNLVKVFRKTSDLFIANSRFCGQMYEKYGVKVDDIIYPPVEIEKFDYNGPRSNDYVLTYIGKETSPLFLEKLVKVCKKKGIKIKAFGMKADFLPKKIKKDIEIYKNIPTPELVKLYGNARLTLFIFNQEPFGYVPVESLAAGTPVLTLNEQGPSESIVDGETGWLVPKSKIIPKLLEIWEQGYDESMRTKCKERAKNFAMDKILKEWEEKIKDLVE